MPQLFDSLQLRDIVLNNRIALPPMCQYSAQDGVAGDWHFVHYSSRAVGGAALMIVEATAVMPEGRISPGDLGLWNDQQIEPLARITRFAQAQGCVAAVQLAHAGRKASVGLGWQAQRTLAVDEGSWVPVAPSALSFGEGYAVPAELDTAAINGIVASFVASTRRAGEAGFQCVELHAAHGYLLHQFLSPLTNRRTDSYGGNFENRTRLVREVVTAVRAAWPERLPLLVRLSATDWVEGGWNADETVELCRVLKTLGVDLIDVSTGGLVPSAKIPAGTGFQTEFAERIRREAQIPTAAVGLITSPEQADHIVRSGQADVVLLGREMLRNPYWPLMAAKTLGVNTSWPVQYLRAAPPGAKGRCPSSERRQSGSRMKRRSSACLPGEAHPRLDLRLPSGERHLMRLPSLARRARRRPNRPRRNSGERGPPKSVDLVPRSDCTNAAAALSGTTFCTA